MLINEIVSSLEGKIVQFFPHLFRWNSGVLEGRTGNFSFSHMIYTVKNLRIGGRYLELNCSFCDMGPKHTVEIFVNTDNSSADMFLAFVMNHPEASKLRFSITPSRNSINFMFSDYSSACNFILATVQSLENFARGNNQYCVEKVF